MKNLVARVYPGSIAEEAEIEVGDKLLSINGLEIKDIIDYKFLITDEYLEIEVEKPSGEIWSIEIEKDYDEELGIEFKEAIMDRARSCNNKCIFCFIDQLPKGMRDTLYFKDDDSRLSFLQGNFVTLTNVSDEEIDRIIRYRISPINVSVHTTNPELRVKMLNNRFAGKVYERMKRMAEAGIEMDCQIVLVPGVNNGEELKRTVEDLFKLYPSVQNIAAVPIGITKFREGLHKIETYDRENAYKEIKLVETLQKKYIKEIEAPFIRLSDEFYILAGLDVPEADFYEGYKQLEDGVGMIRLLRDNVERDIHKLHKNIKGSYTIVTAASAYEELRKVGERISSINNKIKINVEKISNRFFGETITVVGLLTGRDIIEDLKNKDLGQYIIVPNNIVKKGYELGETNEQLLLDDYTIGDIEKALKRKVIMCNYSGEDLISLINHYSEED